VVNSTDGTVRTALSRIVTAGFRAVQLDLTLPGLRPRDLDQRARKDLLALLTRSGISLAGADLFIPKRHFSEAEHLDRAMSAAIAGLHLAADLGRVPLSLALPVSAMSDQARETLVAAADAHGVRLAVHGEDQADALFEWMAQVDLPALGAGLDPAAVLMRNRDPAALAQRLGKRLTVARLSDIAGTGGADDDAAGLRAALGNGDLDIAGYRIAVDLAGGRVGPVVLDLRGMENPMAAAAQADTQWSKAAFVS
jgi:sugar phosphate isomerase/epimerase